VTVRVPDAVTASPFSSRPRQPLTPHTCRLPPALVRPTCALELVYFIPVLPLSALALVPSTTALHPGADTPASMPLMFPLAAPLA